jgi:excisionase family DNA binding protein
MPVKKQLIERVYPDILNMDELRSYLRVSYDTAMQLIKTKKIPAKQIGREWRIVKRSVDDYIMSDEPIEMEVHPNDKV